MSEYYLSPGVFSIQYVQGNIDYKYREFPCGSYDENHRFEIYLINKSDEKTSSTYNSRGIYFDPDIEQDIKAGKLGYFFLYIPKIDIEKSCPNGDMRKPGLINLHDIKTWDKVDNPIPWGYQYQGDKSILNLRRYNAWVMLEQQPHGNVFVPNANGDYLQMVLRAKPDALIAPSIKEISFSMPTVDSNDLESPNSLSNICEMIYEAIEDLKEAKHLLEDNMLSKNYIIENIFKCEKMKEMA